MKHFLALAFAGAVLMPSALEARNYHHRAYHDTPGYYTSVDGDRVHRPMHARFRMAGTSAVCQDGAQSFSRHHRGTCSHHGGVAYFR